MLDIERYLSCLIYQLKGTFASRLLYVGLQGSYLRGEASESSDIDIMVVLDKLEIDDLNSYRSILQSLEYFDKSCGFICSKSDLANWNPLEICHLLHSTRDYYGVLRDWVPVYTEQDIRNFVKISINNLYHEICHRYIHADGKKNETHLSVTYKGVFFILQNLYYLEHRIFIPTKVELLSVLNDKNRSVLQRAIDLNNGAFFNFNESFELLFTWCQETLLNL